MDHTITLRKAGGTWTLRAGGAVLAESTKALELTEPNAPTQSIFHTVTSPWRFWNPVIIPPIATIKALHIIYRSSPRALNFQMWPRVMPTQRQLWQPSKTI